jgi:hypothetical protein
MPAVRSTIYVIAGCNGAGKTTFAKEFLPHEVKCLRFYNADEIARGLSPLAPNAGALKAGRLLLSEVRESIDRHETFALESTLSGKTYVRTFKRALSLGYEVELHYLWLSNVEQAIRACASSRPYGLARCSVGRHSPAIPTQSQSFDFRLRAARDALGDLGQPRPSGKTDGDIRNR